MKKLLIGLLFSTCAVRFADAAPILGTVQITTVTTLTPTLQRGAINIASGTVRGNFVTTGTFTLGADLIVNSTSGLSGQILQSQGAGSVPLWTPASSSSLLSSTNTWTAGQTFASSITVNGAMSASNSAGTAGQSLQTNGTGVAPTWVNVPSAILSTTSTWTAGQIFSSGTFTGQINGALTGVTGTLGTILSTDTVLSAFNKISNARVVQVAYGSIAVGSSTITTTYANTSLSVSIIPTLAANRIVLFAQGPLTNGSVSVPAYATIARTATNLFSANGACETNTATAGSTVGCSMVFIDSPATTSATTYNVQVKSNGSASAIWGDSTVTSSILAVEIGK